MFNKFLIIAALCLGFLGLGIQVLISKGLYVDKTNHSVGIGTTKPASRLHVVGDLTLGDLKTSGSLRIPSVSGSASTILAMGGDINPVILFGYNQRPNYVLDEQSDKGLSWVIEPNYVDGSGYVKMEAYLQYLGTSHDQNTTVRPFMTQIDKVTGLLTETIVSGGNVLTLRMNDGTGGFPYTQVGKRALTFYGKQVAIFNEEADNPGIVVIIGANTAGDVAQLRLQDKVSSQYFSIAADDTAHAMSFKISFGETDFFHLTNTGEVGIGTSSPTSKLQVVGLPVYANNTAAVAGRLTPGAFYRTGTDPDRVCVVH